MVTTDQDRNPAGVPALLHRLWGIVAIPMIPLGLVLWGIGISIDQYWIIVAGTLTMAAGAYRATDR